MNRNDAKKVELIITQFIKFGLILSRFDSIRFEKGCILSNFGCNFELPNEQNAFIQKHGKPFAVCVVSYVFILYFLRRSDRCIRSKNWRELLRAERNHISSFISVFAVCFSGFHFASLSHVRVLILASSSYRFAAKFPLSSCWISFRIPSTISFVSIAISFIAHFDKMRECLLEFGK